MFRMDTIIKESKEVKKPNVFKRIIHGYKSLERPGFKKLMLSTIFVLIASILSAVCISGIDAMFSEIMKNIF